MKHTLLITALTLCFGACAYGVPVDSARFENGQLPPNEGMLIGENQTLRFLDNSGAQLRTIKVAGCLHDLSVLPNGNILYANNDFVREITPDGKTVHQYAPKEKKGGAIFSAQRLANGNTVIGENSTGYIVELDPEFKVSDSFRFLDFQPGSHQNIRLVRKLDNGNYLVCHSGKNIVREYKKDGAVVWELKTPNLAFKAERLKNGNTMVASLGQIAEYTPEKKVVWSFKANEIDGVFIQNMTGFLVRDNGNMIIGCYGAHARNRLGLNFFEITREKKLVWSYSTESFTTVMCMAPIPNEKSTQNTPNKPSKKRRS